MNELVHFIVYTQEGVACCVFGALIALSVALIVIGAIVSSS